MKKLTKSEKNEIEAYDVKSEKDSSLPIDKQRDQTNNFQVGYTAISLSKRNLTDLTGISDLQVMHNGKKTPIKEIKKLHLFVNDDKISLIPQEIKTMDNIIFLYMKDNDLSEIPAYMGNMPHILGVYFTGNKLSSITNEIYNLLTWHLIDDIYKAA